MNIDLSQPWTGRVPLDSICRNPDQPRVTFDGPGLKRLGAALKKRQQQPVRVIPHRDPNDERIRWMLVDGERRWRAGRLVHLESIWVCYEPGVNHNNLHESSLAANFNREGHTKMDTARALQKEIDEGKSVEDLAELIGWSEANVRNYLDLLLLHPELQSMLDLKDKERRLSLRVAVALSKFPKEKQRSLFEKHAQGKRDGDALNQLRISVGVGPRSSERIGGDNRFVVRRISGALEAVRGLNQLGKMIEQLSLEKCGEALVMLEQIKSETLNLKLLIEKRLPN